MRKIFLMGLLIILVAGCTPSTPSPTPIQSIITPPASGKAGTFQYKKTDFCPFAIPTDPSFPKVECGHLTVPEDRSRPNGKTIDLPVVVFPSADGNQAAEPLLFLIGGPGPLLAYLDGLYYSFQNLNTKYALVFMEQRGVGLSKPSLDCPGTSADYYNYYKMLEKDPNSREAIDLDNLLQTVCHYKLRNDEINLAAYTTAASAADLNDLRNALDFSQWTIFSIGYGTVLAAELIRSYPQTVKSAVFLGMLPTDNSWFLEQAIYADSAIQQLFQQCSQDKICGKAYPDLQNTFDDEIDELNVHPIHVQVIEQSSGQLYTVWVNGDRLITLVLMALNSGSNDLLPQVPRLIYQVKNEQEEQLKAFLTAYMLYYHPDIIGMNQRVNCAEYFASTTVEKVMDSNAKASRYIRDYFDRQVQAQADACAIWQADNQVKLTTPQALKSDIPILILAGQYGWSTPADWAVQAAKTLSRSTLVVFPGAGQITNQWTDCANQLSNAFLADPGKMLDTHCSEEQKPTQWITVP